MDTKKPIEQKAEETNIIESAKQNKKTIIGVAVAVVAVAIVVLCWIFIGQFGAKKADQAIAIANIEQNDSLAMEYYKKAATMGHKSGNRAGLTVAIKYYQDGEYQEAINYLKKYSVDSEIIESGRYSLMGDCYVNLEQYEQAIPCYRDAIKASDNNPQIAPFVLVKLANVYRELNKYEDEFHCYQDIFDKYPEYAQSLLTQQPAVDIRKYAERAKANAGL